ncbi:MAG: hypothetical protein SFU56_07595 [Capsulimonadales bacterium]|nr:hypothetical protein [Capsulimonadales bacterium]
MHKYRVPVNCYVYIEAEDDTEALLKAQKWALSVYAEENSQESPCERPPLEGISIKVDDKHVMIFTSFMDRELQKAKEYQETYLLPALVKARTARRRKTSETP